MAAVEQRDQVAGGLVFEIDAMLPNVGDEQAVLRLETRQPAGARLFGQLRVEGGRSDVELDDFDRGRTQQRPQQELALCGTVRFCERRQRGFYAAQQLGYWYRRRPAVGEVSQGGAYERAIRLERNPGVRHELFGFDRVWRERRRVRDEASRRVEPEHVVELPVARRRGVGTTEQRLAKCPPTEEVEILLADDRIARAQPVDHARHFRRLSRIVEVVEQAFGEKFEALFSGMVHQLSEIQR